MIKANIGVDRYSPFNDPAHYMPGTIAKAEERIARLFNEAIAAEKNCDHKQAMKNLGQLLHTVQDMYAHFEQSAGWAEHNPFSKRFTDPDNPKKHKTEYNDALKATEGVLRNFIELSQ